MLVAGLIESHVAKVIPRSELAVFHITIAVVDAIRIVSRMETHSDNTRRMRTAFVGSAAQSRAVDLDDSACAKTVVATSSNAAINAMNRENLCCNHGACKRVAYFGRGSSTGMSEGGAIT